MINLLYYNCKVHVNRHDYCDHSGVHQHIFICILFFIQIFNVIKTEYHSEVHNYYRQNGGDMFVPLVNVSHQILVHQDGQEYQDRVDRKMFRILRAQDVRILEDGGDETKLERDQRIVHKLDVDQLGAKQADKHCSCQSPVHHKFLYIHIMVVLKLLFYQRCSHKGNHNENPPSYINQLNILSLFLLLLTERVGNKLILTSVKKEIKLLKVLCAGRLTSRCSFGWRL